MPNDFVPDFEKKKVAYIESLERINRCNKLLGDQATVILLGGSVDRPVDTIGINGRINIEMLPKMCEILKA